MATQRRLAIALTALVTLTIRASTVLPLFLKPSTASDFEAAYPGSLALFEEGWVKPIAMAP